MLRFASFRWDATLSIVVLASLTGCLPLDFSTWGDQVLSFPAPEPLSGPRVNEVEPNDGMAEANTIVFDGQVVLVGDVAAKDDFDFDVFALGPVEAGDRVVAELAANAGSDIVLGLFDGGFNLLGYVDYSRGTIAPGRIDLVLHESVDTLYVATGTRSVSQTNRLYNVGVTVTPNVGIPPLNPQLVVLNFIGASGVRIGRQTPVNVPPFDVATIDSRLEGKTQEVIQSVLAMVCEDYAGLDIEFYLAGDPNIPAGNLTTIHFGTYSDRYLGLADNVDPFNRDSTQNAIIYTDTFSLFSALFPTQEQIAQVLANVASHELGHLLGLRHTADIKDLMDVTATARQMLHDQWHKVAELHSSIMAIGYQDAATMLSWCVGGTPPVPPTDDSAKAQQTAKMMHDPDDFYIPHDWLAEHSVEAHDAADDQAEEQ